MTNPQHPFRIKLYWITWAWLLVLTVVMVFIGSAELASGLMIPLLLVGMMAKASFIGANFMHLRFEKIALVVIVAAAIIFTAVALFLGIASDGVHIRNLL